jgi:tagatose-1,6-bisphosphate aldolase
LLSDIDGLPVRALSSSVDHASIWASTVAIDLVKGHSDLTTSRNLWKLTVGQGQDSLSTGLDVIVTALKNG